jgi:hypothetical protein
MQTGPPASLPGQVQAGSVVALWRYPVKSMMGEELNSSQVTDRGLLGDRQFAVVDRSTGKVAGAKNPRKWGSFFDFRAAYAEPPKTGARISPVRITLPDGTVVTTGQAGVRCRVPGQRTTTPAYSTSPANPAWTDDQVAHRFTGATEHPILCVCQLQGE